MKAQRLPGLSGTGIFTTIQARDAGASVSRLRANDLSAPSRGLRVETANTPALAASLAASMRAHLAVTPGGFASHVTAAKLWGIPLPQAAEGQRVIDISRKNPAQRPRRRGVLGHQLRIEREEIILRDGIWLTTPARTWCDLASLLAEEDLVVAGDFLVRSRTRDFSEHRKALCTVAELTTLRLPRARANALRRAAAAKVRLGVDSPQESRLRLCLVRAGLPEPLVNHSLDDDFDGRPLRWADLAYPEYKIVIQYEGDHHRSRKRLAADIARDEDWQRAGWTVVRLTSGDLQAAGIYAVAKVRAALLRSGWQQR